MRSKTIVGALAGALLLCATAQGLAAPPSPPRGGPGGPDAPQAPPIGSIPRLEALYVPIATCRIAATNASTAGIFIGNTTRNFYVRGTSGFPAQGGKSGGCGIPETATAVVVSATVTTPSAAGFMALVDPGGGSQTRFISYAKSASVTSNPTFRLAALGVEPSLSLKSSQAAAAHLFLDAVGYFVPQIEGMIASGGGLYSGSTRLVSATRTGTGAYSVTIDQDVTYCSVKAQPYSYGLEAHAYAFSGSTVTVYVFSQSGGTTTATDDYVYLTVTC